MTLTTTTAALTTTFGTHHALVAIETDAYTITVLDGTGYTLTFADADAAIAAVEKAKVTSWTRYMRNGGNPRNKRSHGTQFAAVKKAIVKAA